MRIRPFRDGSASSTLRGIVERTVREIETLESDYVLNAALVELEEYYVSKVRIEPLTLCSSEYYIDKQEGTQIDVSHGFRRAGFGNGPILVKGTVLDIAVPFTGDPDLWRVQPSSFSISGYPPIEVRDGVVVFSCEFADDAPDAERLKVDIERAVESLDGAVATLSKDVERHNQDASREVLEALHRKLTVAKAAVGAIARLGIPIRRRAAPEVLSFQPRGATRRFDARQSRQGISIRSQ
ncbi:MAG: hypothetical protein OXQ31_25260 [Spirochaetaceae bacterium]|nr:hypothetical protein [Spirochaetaceae bacterium]